MALSRLSRGREDACQDVRSGVRVRAASAAAAVRAAAREQWECGGGLSDYCHGARAASQRAGSGSGAFRARSHGPAERHFQDAKDCWSGFQRGSAFEVPGPAIPRPLLTTGHIPVLLYECLEVLLACGLNGTYVDCTFGRGGHSTQILKRLHAEGRLFAFDVDPTAIKAARVLEVQDSRFRIIHQPFGDIEHAIPHGVELSGVLMDIGFSSPQVDEAHRGHSFFLPGPLDLRMNQSSGIPASEWLRTVTAEELAWVIREYGEDNDPYMARRIAEAVLEYQRSHGPYTSTLALADAVAAVKGVDDCTEHPAKLTFQAIRVFMNSEMPQLKAAMAGALARVRFHGRLVVISFKEKEATAIRSFIREHEDCGELATSAASPEDLQHLAELYPLLCTGSTYALRQVCNPIRPSAEEVRENSRSRSAMVHVMEKVPRRGPRLQACVSSQPDESHEARVVRLLQEAKLVQPMPPSFGMTSSASEWAILKMRRDSPHQQRVGSLRTCKTRAMQLSYHVSGKPQRLQHWRCTDCEVVQPPRLARCSRCGAKPPDL